MQAELDLGLCRLLEQRGRDLLLHVRSKPRLELKDSPKSMAQFPVPSGGLALWLSVKL